ncbi:MAG: Asp-tRNA(Asn)/Glu-tRNA(Gln) amidotransferase subunit GatC [Candidatus Acidiferrales bacterium]
MTISRDDVARVAELAHLELSPEEVEMYLGQLDDILSYIDKLKQLDVANVEPMAQVAFTRGVIDTNTGAIERTSFDALREDTPRPCDVAQAVLEEAPDATKPFFRVPKVIER